MSVAGVWITIQEHEAQGVWGLGAAAIFGGFGWLNLRMATCFIRLDHYQLTVRNVVRRHEATIESVRAFEVGLGIGGARGQAILTDGRRIPITALSKNQITHSLGRRTRADAAAERLNAILEAARSGGAEYGHGHVS